MGHNFLGRNRPIVGTTPDGVGATYVVVEGYEDDLNIQTTVNGTVTYTVDWTVQNVLYDAAAIAAVNIGPQVSEANRYIDPSAAQWKNLIVSGSVDADSATGFPIFALRINITAGTGSVSYAIAQA